METSEIQDCVKILTQARPEHEIAILQKACECAIQAHHGQKRASGEPFYLHAIAVAETLSLLHMDYETIAAALLHDVVEDTDIDLEFIQKEFGTGIAKLVDGVTKMDQMQDLAAVKQQDFGEDKSRSESLRKMLLAMAEDIRVVLIKLADRLHNMRTLSSLSPDKQRRIALETMEIFAPLANRLGIWQLKWQLEDLSFRYLYPDTYSSIADMLSESRSDREKYINDFISQLYSEMESKEISVEISGRPKHIYGIWKKMQKKNIDFYKVYDVLAVRITAKKVEDCYAVLGVIHSLWKYIPGEFDDYIATPKENNYRSIHTAVIGPKGKTVEVQIRTADMHRQAEYGVAAHWRYKEGINQEDKFDQKIAWLRQLLEWKDEITEAGEFVDRFKSEIFSDRVYVLTPKGNIFDLPKGATPLDFAYHIHTEVGHRCRGAKVNGNIVPLTYILSTGERVEVLTVKKGGPSRDWMNFHLGYLQTSKARSKVKQWFRHQGYENTVSEGRSNLERELKRLGITDVAYETIAKKLGYNDLDDFFAAVGRGETKMPRILATIQDRLPSKRADTDQIGTAKASHHKVTGAVQIQGVGNLLTNIARCCQPVPGDPITGYITLGRGVTIHRSDCTNALKYSTEAPDRLVAVNWGEKDSQAYPVDIIVRAYDRHGLLSDITTLLSNESINVLAANTSTDKSLNVARIGITLEIPDIDTLHKILGKMEQLANVISVRRKLN